MITAWELRPSKVLESEARASKTEAVAGKNRSLRRFFSTARSSGDCFTMFTASVRTFFA